MWNFFKPRAAGVFGVTVYIIWKKNFMWGRLWGRGMFGTKRGGISDTCRMIWFTKVYTGSRRMKTISFDESQKIGMT